MFIENFLLGETSASVTFVLMVYDVVLFALAVISLFWCRFGSALAVPVWLISPVLLNVLSSLLGAIGLESAGDYVFANRFSSLVAIPLLLFILVRIASYFDGYSKPFHPARTTRSSSSLPRRYKYVGPDSGPVDPYGWGVVRRDGMNANLSDAELDRRIAEREDTKPTFLLRLERSRRHGVPLV